MPPSLQVDLGRKERTLRRATLSSEGCRPSAKAENSFRVENGTRNENGSKADNGFRVDNGGAKGTMATDCGIRSSMSKEGGRRRHRTVSSSDHTSRGVAGTLTIAIIYH